MSDDQLNNALTTIPDGDQIQAMKHYAEGQILELTYQLTQIAAIAQQQDDRSMWPEIKYALNVANNIANQLETDFDEAIAQIAGLQEMVVSYRDNLKREIIRSHTIREEGHEEGFADGVMHAYELEDSLEEAAVEWLASQMIEHDDPDVVAAAETEKLQRRLDKAREDYEFHKAYLAGPRYGLLPGESQNDD
jgi:hypothetical protein